MMHRFQFVIGHGKKRTWSQIEEKKLTGTSNIQGVEKLKMAKAFMECVGEPPEATSSSELPAPKSVSAEAQALEITLVEYRHSAIAITGGLL